ncbi:MAG: hypothetical protein ABI881_03490 [Betaproteobacteria bacterium]
MHDRSHRDDRAQVAPPVSSSPPTETSRRRFLFALGATGAGAAAASAAALAATAVPQAATATTDHRESRGYRETDHVRSYYATART